MTDVVTIAGGRPLRGRLRVPGDKSISHRALIVAALAKGSSRLRGLSDGADVGRTAAAVAALGATVTEDGVTGNGGLHQPDAPIDAGNSGTTMRLLAGAVAAYPVDVELFGDASLSGRPMDRVAEPLRAMGAEVAGIGERCRPPLRVRGGALHGIDYTPPVASAQVKSCVLLAGLGASGETVVREPVPTRRHTEELLEQAGVAVSATDEHGARVVRVRASTLQPIDLEVPGDPSQAAFWVVAASLVPGSDLVVERVYTGPQRRGFLDVLRRMGGAIDETPVPGAMAHVTDIHVAPAPLSATTVDAAEITGLDEVPVLAVAAAAATGTTVFRDMGELRVKESDRFEGVVALVRAVGADAEVDGDDIAVTGTGRLRSAATDAKGDHRMAMAGAVAALAAGGESTVTGWHAVATSYPAFLAHLRLLTGFGDEVGA